MGGSASTQRKVYWKGSDDVLTKGGICSSNIQLNEDEASKRLEDVFDVDKKSLGKGAFGAIYPITPKSQHGMMKRPPKDDCSNKDLTSSEAEAEAEFVVKVIPFSNYGFDVKDQRTKVDNEVLLHTRACFAELHDSPGYGSIKQPGSSDGSITRGSNSLTANNGAGQRSSHTTSSYTRRNDGSSKYEVHPENDSIQTKTPSGEVVSLEDPRTDIETSSTRGRGGGSSRVIARKDSATGLSLMLHHDADAVDLIINDKSKTTAEKESADVNGGKKRKMKGVEDKGVVLAGHSRATPHPRILRVRDTFLGKQGYCIVLDRCYGSLAQWLDTQSFITEDIIRRIALCMVQAVQRCHYLGIAHRDIKLHNFLFADKNQSPDSVVLCDFGAAMDARDSKEMYEIVVGSTMYDYYLIDSHLSYYHHFCSYYSMQQLRITSSLFHLIHLTNITHQLLSMSIYVSIL